MNCAIDAGQFNPSQFMYVRHAHYLIYCKQSTDGLWLYIGRPRLAAGPTQVCWLEYADGSEPIVVVFRVTLRVTIPLVKLNHLS